MFVASETITVPFRPTTRRSPSGDQARADAQPPGAGRVSNRDAFAFLRWTCAHPTTIWCGSCDKEALTRPGALIVRADFPVTASQSRAEKSSLELRML